MLLKFADEFLGQKFTAPSGIQPVYKVGEVDWDRTKREVFYFHRYQRLYRIFVFEAGGKTVYQVEAEPVDKKGHPVGGSGRWEPISNNKGELCRGESVQECLDKLFDRSTT